MKGDVQKKQRGWKENLEKRKMEKAGNDRRERKISTKERPNCDKVWHSFGTSRSVAPALSTQ